MKWLQCVPNFPFIASGGGRSLWAWKKKTFKVFDSFYLTLDVVAMSSVKYSQSSLRCFQNRLSAVKPYHRAFNFSSWYVKREAKRTVPQKIVVSKPFQSEISSVYLMSLEVLHFFQSSDISPYKSRVSVQVNPWHWTLFTTFNKYPICSKTSHLMIQFLCARKHIVYHNAPL